MDGFIFAVRVVSFGDAMCATVDLYSEAGWMERCNIMQGSQHPYILATTSVVIAFENSIQYGSGVALIGETYDIDRVRKEVNQSEEINNSH